MALLAWTLGRSKRPHHLVALSLRKEIPVITGQKAAGDLSQSGCGDKEVFYHFTEWLHWTSPNRMRIRTIYIHISSVSPWKAVYNGDVNQKTSHFLWLFNYQAPLQNSLLESPRLLMLNAIVQKNPQYFLQATSGIHHVKACSFIWTSLYHTWWHLLTEMLY
jgi:hypothetical protein